jgi:hypothetical protein
LASNYFEAKMFRFSLSRRFRGISGYKFDSLANQFAKAVEIEFGVPCVAIMTIKYPDKQMVRRGNSPRESWSAPLDQVRPGVFDGINSATITITPRDATPEVAQKKRATMVFHHAVNPTTVNFEVDPHVGIIAYTMLAQNRGMIPS